MNKRIVLVSSEECHDYVGLYGLKLDCGVYTLELLEKMDEEQRNNLLTLGEGDGAVLVGAKAFSYLREKYHFGIRGENYFDCSRIYRVSLEGGAYVRCAVDVQQALIPGLLEDFMSPNFTREVNYLDFKWCVIHTVTDALRYLDYIDSLPLDTDFGFDYETSGMPMEKVFFVSGFAISTAKEAVFISLTDLRHEVGESSEGYRAVLDKLAKFLSKRMKHIWTYNLQFEYQVSHRIMGVDLYELSDASVVNVLDGLHEKNYSLKWTAQRVLGVKVWDSDFDRLSDLIEHMLLEEVGKLKKDIHLELRVTPENFTNTPEWKEICKRYPGYEDEFKELILEYWGNQFMPIPSEILGKYCCLDSFYTLMIYLKKKSEYTEECFNVFLDNLRLGARLMSHGHYIDEPFRLRFEKYCKEMMAWSSTWATRALCWIKMQKHQSLATNIKRYKPIAVKLLEEGNFFQGNITEILKYILTNNLDYLDSTETGLNEGGLVMKYGQEFGEKFVDFVRQTASEVKLKGKIDEGIIRKKKFLGVLAEKTMHLFGIDSLKFDSDGKVNKKHIELEKYMYYRKIYTELEKINKKQLKDIHNIPEKIYIFGKKMDLLEYSKFLSDNYFMCLSPEQNDKIIYDMMVNPIIPGLKGKTAFLAAMSESIQQLPETTKFYSSRGITDIDEGYQEMLSEWKKYYDSNGEYESSLYPKKVFDLAFEFYGSPKLGKKVSVKGVETVLYQTADKVKEIWTDFLGFNTQTQLFPEYQGDYLNYESPFDPEVDLSNDFYFMRKFTLNYLIYKKHAKMLSVYVGPDGMFNKRAKWVIEDEHHIPIRDADPDEPGAVKKNFTPYEVLKKSSKRWSSSFHTIPSHSPVKNCLIPAPIRNKNGNIIYGGDDQLLTYFDIN